MSSRIRRAPWRSEREPGHVRRALQWRAACGGGERSCSVPGWLRFSAPSVRAGLAWERNSSSPLSRPRVGGVQAVCEGATVTQELLKEGFHRDLLLKVELGVVGEHAGGCTVAARTHLPPGIYVDPYELALLQQHNLTKAVLIPEVVDVEAPEYLATDLLVLLYLEPDPWCSHCFTAALPVHGRYHRPAEDSEEALVILKSPEVLVCCCDNRLPAECWKPAEVEAACSGKNARPCQWYSVTHKSAHEESILQVPVGLRQHSSMVCAVTLLATVLCSSLILAAVCKYGQFSEVTCSE